jgi:hypothetical protein
MIDIVPKPLSDYLKMLSTGQHFSFTRYWDGEMASIVGRTGKNIDSCDYSRELCVALRATIALNKKYYHGLFNPSWSNNTKNLRRQFEEYLLAVNSRVMWYDAMVFQRAFERGGFFPVIKALRARECVLVGGVHLRPVIDILNLKLFIEAPKTDAFIEIKRIEDDVRDAALNITHPVVIFSAGMASNCIIDDLHGEINATMVDMGSVWDATLSLRTRKWMRSIPEEVVRRNVYG